jgi:hypothetical protein
LKNIPIFDKYNKNNGIPTIAYKIVAIFPSFVAGAILPYPVKIIIVNGYDVHYHFYVQKQHIVRGF